MAALIFVAFALQQALTWPDVGALKEHDPETTAFIDAYRREEAAAARDAKRRPKEPLQRWVPYRRIALPLKRAVLVGEDIDFFDHDGFATGELEAALRAAVEEGKPLRGASTISQQLAKNLWLSPSRNPWRKVKEAILTVQLERTLEKRRILELYLNVVELGPGIYGVETAARHYFGKSASEVTDAEAAALAAALPSPSRWNPSSKSEVAQRRRETILRRMAKATWLDKSL